MATYQITAPDGNTYRINGPDGASQQDVINAVIAQHPMAGQTTQQLQEAPNAPLSIGDIARSFGTSAVGTAKSFSDIFGADSGISKYLGETQKSLESGFTPARQEEMARDAELIARAKKEGLGAEALANLKSVMHAPFQSAAGIAGGVLPFIAGTVALPEEAVVAGGMTAAELGNLGLGMVSGLGGAKGAEFERAKAEALKQGKSEAEASRIGEQAQQYSLQNLPAQAGSTVIGGLMGSMGAPSVATKALKKSITPEGTLVGEKLQQAIAALPEKERNDPTFMRALYESVRNQAGLGAAQGAVEQYGGNVAAQQAGADVTPGEGVLGSAIQGGTTGLLGGALFSPLHQMGMKGEYQSEQFLRNAKREQELDAKKQAALQKQQEERQKTETELGVPKMLALPAPARDYVPPSDPLQDPVGRITRNELGNAIGDDSVTKYVDQYRADNNMPPLKSFSIEDIKDAMTSMNPEGEQGALNSILAYKTGYKGEEYKPEDVLKAAQAKSIATGTKGWDDYLKRAAGSSDLETMEQPQLHSVIKALDSLPRNENQEPLVLPEGSNASRFDKDQYEDGLTHLNMVMDEKGGPVLLSTARQAVKDQLGLKTDRDAEHFLRTAAANDDLSLQPGTAFQATKGDKVLGTFATEEEAKKSTRRAEINPVDAQFVVPREEPKTEKRAPLPEGYEIEKNTVEGDQAPAGFAIRQEDSQKNIGEIHLTEDAAKAKLEALQASREKLADSEEAQAESIRKNLERKEQAVTDMEAAGETGTPDHAKAVRELAVARAKGSDQMVAHMDRAQELRKPVKIVPQGKKATPRETHTITKNGKKIGTFKSREEAERQLLSQLSDEELAKVATDTRHGGITDRAKQEQYQRGLGDYGRGITKSPPDLSEEFKAKADEIGKQLKPLLSKLGLKNVDLEVVSSIKNSAEGSYFHKLIQVAIDAKEPVRVMRHETLHALRDLGFFTDEQWNALTRQADKVWVDKYLKDPARDVEVDGKKMSRYDGYKYLTQTEPAEWNKAHPNEPQRKVMTDAEFKDMIREEAIADAFADFDANKAPPGMLSALLNKIKSFFEALRNSFNNAGFQTAEDVFKQAEGGKLKGEEAGEGEEKYQLRGAAKVMAKVSDQLGMDLETLKATSLGLQTGKPGREQFVKNNIGGLKDVARFLEDRRRASGLPIFDVNKPEDRKQISDLMAAEALSSINSGKGNLEWYDETIAKTMSKAALKYPELATNPDDQMAFKLAMAITSQGLNVEDNLAFAMKQYESYRNNKHATGVGKFDVMGQGADGAAMTKNFALANKMIDEYGVENVRKFMETEFPVEELRKAGFDISGELGDEVVTGSSIFGPKIGFGFYSNLNGNFEPVTMDMWFMRLIGRLTGNLKDYDPELFKQQVDRFHKSFDEAGSDGVYADDFTPEALEKAKESIADTVEFARVVNSVFNIDFKKNREQYDEGARRKSDLVYAAQNIIKSYDSPRDAPSNGTERRNLRDIVRQTVKTIEDAHGERVPPAALQALVWYPEQELYSALGVKLRVTSQDYSGAITKILKKEGFSDAAISAAEQSGSRGLQRLASQTAKQKLGQLSQKPSAAFTEQQKREFLQEARAKTIIEQERQKAKRKKIVFEVAPDPNNKELSEKWNAYSQDERLAISNRIAKKIIEKAKEVFGTEGVITSQVGSYENNTNPSFAFFIDKGDPVEISKFLGYALSQDSMIVISPKEGKGLEKRGAVVVDVNTQNPKDVEALYNKLREIKVGDEQPIGGQSTMNGKMILLNYSNVETAKLADLIDEKLGKNYDVAIADVYSAFPTKEDYNYASPSNDPRGKGAAIRERARSLRAEATQLLADEIGFKQKLSLRFAEPALRPSPDGGIVLGEKQNDAQSFVGLHYGQNKVTELSGSKYGTGIRGGERRRLAETDDNRIKKRIYFYIPKEDGSMPKQEAGLGGHVYTQQFDNIAAGKVVDRLYGEAKGDPNQFESNVVDAGYDGYAMPNMGMMVILNHDAPVEYHGTMGELAESDKKFSLGQAPDTPEFKRWFGDSKVVDADGKPMVVYHGTGKDFSEFKYDPKKAIGIWTARNPEIASQYADISSRGGDSPSVYPVYLSIKNPASRKDYLRTRKIAEAKSIKESRWADHDARHRQLLIDEGFDGIYLQNITKDPKEDVYIAFEPTQIKSATGNKGTYDVKNPDIRYSLRTHFPSAEEAEDAAYKKAPPATPEFKRFFGGSKVKEEGRPQVMYHASPNDFNTFRENKPIFVSPTAKEAEYFGKRHRTPEKMDVNIYPLWVRAETPFDFENPNHIRRLGDVLALDKDMVDSIKEGHWETIESQDVQDALKDAGFDSFFVKEYKTKNLAVFDANQVKSVTGNIGDFGENKDMRFSLPTVSAAAKARRDETTTRRVEEGWVARVTDAFKSEAMSDLRAKLIHRYNRFGEYESVIADRMYGGIHRMAEVNAEAAANMSDLSASITASVFGIGNRKGGIPVLKNGFTTTDTSVKSPLETLKPLAQFGSEAYQDYQFWAGVKRGTRLDALGKEKNFDAGDRALAKEYFDGYKAKGVDFDQIHKELNEFNNGIVKYMVDTGVITPEMGKEYVKYADYIPFYRQMDGEKTHGPKVFNNLSGVKPPKKLKGGEAPLGDFLENLVRNTQSAINSGMKNVAMQKALDAALMIGDISGAERLKGIHTEPDTVQVLEKGKQVSYRVADQLFINACKSLNMGELPLLGLVAAPANFLRNMVTKDPGFMLANLARDSLAAWVTSGTNATPIIGTFGNFMKALAGKNPSMDTLLKAGILGGYEFSSGVLKSGKVLERDLQKKYGKATGTEALLKPFTSVWDALEHGTEASDAATRTAIYERVMQETGNEAEALYRSLEVMNFNRKGSSALVRILTAAIPFLNARIQGLDVLYRTGMGRNVINNNKAMQKAFFVRGATLMALSAAYYMLVKDDPEWQKQEQETKDNNWILPGVGKFPTPFEVGFLFKTVPERTVAWLLGNETTDDVSKSLYTGIQNNLQLTPSAFIPQALKPIYEYSTNYSFFTGRPIVGQEMQGIAEKYQVGPNTSKTAAALGEATGLSPLKLDQFIKSYTGTMGTYAVMLADSVLNSQSNSPHASLRFEQLPIVKRVAADPEARGNITQYYQFKQAVDTAVQTENLLLKTARPEEYAKFAQENAGLLANRQYISDMEKSMKPLREQRKMILSADMSPDDKRDALTAIGQAENNLTQNIQTIKTIASKI